jgi:hypothetical protein
MCYPFTFPAAEIDVHVPAGRSADASNRAMHAGQMPCETPWLLIAAGSKPGQ